MKYTTEKIILTLLSLEIIAAIFISCFYYDLYNATLNGKSSINEYGKVIHTPACSWSVTLKEDMAKLLNPDA